MKSREERLQALEALLMTTEGYIGLREILAILWKYYYNDYAQCIYKTQSKEFNNTIQRRTLTDDLSILEDDEDKEYIILRNPRGIKVLTDCKEDVQQLVNDKVKALKMLKKVLVKEKKLTRHGKYRFDNLFDGIELVENLKEVK